MPRVLKIAGDGLEYTVKEFVGADLKDNFDVIVIEGSTVPTSKVIKRQDIMNMFQSGLMGNPQDTKLQAKVLKMMEYGDEAEVWKEQALDDAQVKLVISAIEKNDKVTVQENLSEFDNQQNHLKEMNIYRKSDKYRNLSKEQKDLFLWVMEWRLNALTNTQNPQIGQQLSQAQAMVDSMHDTIGMPGQHPAEQAVAQAGSEQGPMPGQPAQLNPMGGGQPAA